MASSKENPPLPRPCSPWPPDLPGARCRTDRDAVITWVYMQGMEATPVDGWQRYLTPSIALFEVVDDDLLPIRPIGIQVAG